MRRECVASANRWRRLRGEQLPCCCGGACRDRDEGKQDERPQGSGTLDLAFDSVEEVLDWLVFVFVASM